MASRSVHQALFGYDDGHRLLASSTRLSPSVTASLTVASDLAPDVRFRGSDGYWTGLPLPEVAGAVLSRLGSASIALGLLMVGAGLRLSGLREGKLMALYFTAIKLMAIPAVAYLLGRWIGLPPLQLQIVVLFCSLPTASSCYILAARMGGNGPITAFLISLGTLVSAVTIPFWLSLVT